MITDWKWRVSLVNSLYIVRFAIEFFPNHTKSGVISKPSQTRIEWNWKSFQFSFSLTPNKGIEKNRIANEINSTFPQTKRTVRLFSSVISIFQSSCVCIFHSPVWLVLNFAPRCLKSCKIFSILSLLLHF